MLIYTGKQWGQLERDEPYAGTLRVVLTYEPANSPVIVTPHGFFSVGRTDTTDEPLGKNTLRAYQGANDALFDYLQNRATRFSMQLGTAPIEDITRQLVDEVDRHILGRR